MSRQKKSQKRKQRKKQTYSERYFSDGISGTMTEQNPILEIEGASIQNEEK